MPLLSRARVRQGRRRTLSIGQTRALGLAVIAAALAVIVIGVVKPNPFASYEVARAEFSDASGIGVVGADVRVAGTRVGQISGVQRDGDHALLTLHLDRSVGSIRRDASAELRPHLAFEGTAYVDLNPGSASAPPLGSSAIPLSQTRVYVPLDEALRVLNAPTRAATQATVRELWPILTGAGRAGLQHTLRAAPELTSTLAPAALAAQGPHGTELAGAVRGLSRTVAALAGQESQLVPLMHAAASSFAAINPDGGSPLDHTLAQLPPTLTQLDAGGQALDGIVARLDPLSSDLLPGLRDLAPTLDAALPLVAALRPALNHASPFLADVRAALSAGAAAVPATRTVLANLEPSLKLLDQSLLPALHANTKKLGIPAYLAFLNLFEGGGGASRPFQTGNEPGAMGAGHFMRFGFRFITGAGYPLPPCTLLAKASPQLAEALANAGGCNP
jgi:ABC-type transporter Mla subunit MlaD